MTVDDVLDHVSKTFGVKRTYRDVAPYVHVHYSRLADWRKSGIPFRKQAELQVLTDGALKAEPRKESMPS